MENGHGMSLMSRVTTVTSHFFWWKEMEGWEFLGYTVMMQQRNMKDDFFFSF